LQWYHWFQAESRKSTGWWEGEWTVARAAGMVGLESCAGHIARCLDDVAVFMEAVEAAKMREIDAAIVPGRWWSRCDGSVGRAQGRGAASEGS